MAQTGYTPLLVYGSTTPGNTPSAANLTTSASGVELAINAFDGKLFYKDASGNVQVLAVRMPNSILPIANGGTNGTATPTAGAVAYGTGSAYAFSAAGSSGQVLISGGTGAPTWSNLSSIGVTTLSFGTTGLTPSTATSGAITVAGTLATTNGGTGLTSFTANRVFYASSTSAIAQSANLTFDGTTLTANNFTDSSLTSGRVTYATTGGNLTDSANLLYSGTDLTVYGITVGRGAGAVGTNTVVGSGALITNATAGGITAIGFQSGRNYNTSGDSFGSTFVGVVSGTSTTTGSNNAFFGGYSGYSNTSGSTNTAIGAAALYSNTTASNNTAVGYQAGYANTTGELTAVGYNSLQNNTTGIGNAAFGGTALQLNTTGTGNTAIGSIHSGVVFGALRANTTGNQNTAVGAGALVANTTASFNTAVGYVALSANTTGQGNTAIGQNAANAGTPLTTGSNNTLIGASSAVASGSDSGCIVIGVNTAGKGSNTGFINPQGGGVFQGNNSSSWSTTSDERIKQNFVPVTNGLEIVNALDPFEFDYIVTGKHEVGFKAQQYMTVLPDQVGKHAASPEEKAIVGEDEIYGIQRNLDPYFVSAIKSLTEQVNQLKAELAALKGA